MSTGFSLMVGGKWVDLPDVQAGVPVSTERAESAFVSLLGARTIYRAPRASRSWDVRYVWDSPTTVALLAHAASGLAGDVWLLDHAAARTNMLKPHQAVGPHTGPTISVDGISMGLLPLGTAEVPVRQGVAYRLSGWTAATEGQLIGTCLVDAVATNIYAPPGAGPRPWSTSRTPAVDGPMTIIAADDQVTALRLVEEPVNHAAFMPGVGTPCRVSVADPAQTMQMLLAGEAPRSDWAITLREVG